MAPRPFAHPGPWRTQSRKRKTGRRPGSSRPTRPPGSSSSPPTPRLKLRLNIVAICIYFSGVLALTTVALLLRGPLHGAGPVRVLIPQPAMCAVVFVVWARAPWHPCHCTTAATRRPPARGGPAPPRPRVPLAGLLVLGGVVGATFVFLIVHADAVQNFLQRCRPMGIGTQCQRSSFGEILRAQVRQPAGAWRRSRRPCSARSSALLVLRSCRGWLGQTRNRAPNGTAIHGPCDALAASVCLAS